MLHVGSQDYTLDPKSLILLDEALRMAFTRLYDADVLDLDHLDKMRDVLITSMVPPIMRGETDVWRLARRGIFAGSAKLAEDRTGDLDSPSVATE